MLSPEIRVNATKIGKLLDEDFFEIGASGQHWSRSETLEALVQEDAGQAVDRSSRNEGLGRRLRSRASHLRLDEGRPPRARWSSLWRQSDDPWRLVFQHGTLV